MHRRLSHREQQIHILTQIYEGMNVYDAEGGIIGTVQHVHLGDATEEADELGLGPATMSDLGRSENSLLDHFAKAIAPGQTVPQELRQRLLRHGFIKIDCAGILVTDRYAVAISQPGVVSRMRGMSSTPITAMATPIAV